MRVLLVIPILLIAGCADVADEAAPTEPIADTAAPELPTDSLPAVNVTAVSDALLNLTEFHWGTKASLGDSAFAITIDFGSSNGCSTTSSVTGAAEQSGTRTIHTSGRGWGASGGGNLINVDTPIASTDDLMPSGGQYGSASGSGGTLDGVVTFTRVAVGVGPINFDFLRDGHAMGFSVTCDKPFDVLGARVGYEAIVGDTDTLDDGAAASAFLVGAAGAGTQSLEVTADQGAIMFGSFGNQVGAVSLITPASSQDFVLPAETRGMLEGGPGTYTVSVERAGAGFEAYWHAAFGLQHDVDLLAGIQDEPVFSFGS